MLHIRKFSINISSSVRFARL